ncbi:hypothetical protein C1646_665098 [Rhizophagus diaphanus]|nr:hypothetical protein C1646_665098 [Rhizophagus diaphanus] [Rhizophagus sp. MUCL 43196]
MGVSISTEDFATLEKYIYKNEEEQATILQNTGWELEAQDHDIVIFMGTDVITTTLIRAVVTVCLIKQKETMDNFYNKIVVESKKNFDATIKQLYTEGQKLEHELHITKDRLLKQDKELEQYFKAMPINQHIANIEVGENE